MVEKFEKEGYKLVKAYADLYTVGEDNVSISKFSPVQEDGEAYYLGIAVLPIDSTNMEDAIDWSQFLEALYQNCGLKECTIRLFDRERNEIVEGSRIIKKGYLSYNEGMYDDSEYPLDNYDEDTIIEVYRFDNILCFRDEDSYIPIEQLNLLKWELV